MIEKTHPETKYWGKRISECGHQPVYKQLLPDGEPTELSPTTSQKLYNHSPDGFQWGYGGSGPAQLALALLMDVTGNPRLALDHYQNFKFDVVACWGETWSITSQEILRWIGLAGSKELQKRCWPAGTEDEMKICAVCRCRTARIAKERYCTKTLCPECYDKGWRLIDIGKKRRHIVAALIFNRN